MELGLVSGQHHFLCTMKMQLLPGSAGAGELRAIPLSWKVLVWKRRAEGRSELGPAFFLLRCHRKALAQMTSQLSSARRSECGVWEEEIWALRTLGARMRGPLGKHRIMRGYLFKVTPKCSATGLGLSFQPEVDSVVNNRIRTGLNESAWGGTLRSGISEDA